MQTVTALHILCFIQSMCSGAPTGCLHGPTMESVSMTHHFISKEHHEITPVAENFWHG